MTDHSCCTDVRAQGVLASRLLLSVMHEDGAAVDTLTDELGECAQCWRRVAWRLAELTHGLMTVTLRTLLDAPDADEGNPFAAQLIESSLLSLLDSMPGKPHGEDE